MQFEGMGVEDKFTSFSLLSYFHIFFWSARVCVCVFGYCTVLCFQHLISSSLLTNFRIRVQFVPELKAELEVERDVENLKPKRTLQCMVYKWTCNFTILKNKHTTYIIPFQNTYCLLNICICLQWQFSSPPLSPWGPLMRDNKRKSQV